MSKWLSYYCCLFYLFDKKIKPSTYLLINIDYMNIQRMMNDNNND